ncbi:N-acetylmuramoyl-L-alanine amidase family protein [Salinimicrobium sp. GXAS 041]|uniref:N-acetylmuramoyl-L-alanine amidase family protein n=1 Tax=Salinimicrobium sp. GXAS 041 TaxID=3400806 RepID=UPI003C7400FA
MRTNLLTLLVLLFTGIFCTGFAAENNSTPREKFVVVLDAGHGGDDPGNRGNGYFEKDIALNIVLKIGAELEKLPDVEVIYTRKTDVFVTLAGRAEIANDADADLFISVHCNAHNSQASGTETFVLGLHRNEDNLEVAMRENSVIFLEENYEATYDGFNPNSPESYIGLTLMQEEYLDQSILLADFIQKKFTNDLRRKNRGVKQAGFLVLRQTYMPSVLIETGFLSNNEEGAYLNSRSGQDKISDAVVKAVNSYKNSLNLDVLEDLSQRTDIDLLTSTKEAPVQVYDGITFKVQLAASSRKLDPAPKNFKGLANITRNKEGKLFKYYYGATSSYLKIKELHEEAKNRGYRTSYIVAFKDGTKISVNDALKQK